MLRFCWRCVDCTPALHRHRVQRPDLKGAVRTEICQAHHRRHSGGARFSRFTDVPGLSTSIIFKDGTREPRACLQTATARPFANSNCAPVCKWELRAHLQMGTARPFANGNCAPICKWELRARLQMGTARPFANGNCAPVCKRELGARFQTDRFLEVISGIPVITSRNAQVWYRTDGGPFLLRFCWRCVDCMSALHRHRVQRPDFNEILRAEICQAHHRRHSGGARFSRLTDVPGLLTLRDLWRSQITQ